MSDSKGWDRFGTSGLASPMMKMQLASPHVDVEGSHSRGCRASAKVPFPVVLTPAIRPRRLDPRDHLVALDTPLRRAQGRLDASFGVSTHQMVVEYEGEKARTEGTKTHVRCSRLHREQGGDEGALTSPRSHRALRMRQWTCV